FMRYVGAFPGGKFALLFQLMSLGAFFYAGLILAFFAANKITLAHETFGFLSPLSATVTASPYTYLYLSGLLLRSFLVGGLVLVLACFSTTLFYWIRSFSSPLPKDGLRV